VTTDLQSILAARPNAVKSIDRYNGSDNWRNSTKYEDVTTGTVRWYCHANSIARPWLDSIETLLDAIEAKLKAERPMSDEEIEGMKWTSLGCMVGPKQVVTFHAANDSHASSALTRHNSDIDTLHAEIKRWRAKAEGKQ